MAGHKKRNGGCGCGGMCGNPKCRNPSLNVRNPSRSVHTGSEDYRIGLFQGAIEKGKIPPPHNTSADLRRGYADGAKVAKAKPAMVAEALGVYKATSNQQQAGAVLYSEVKGESVATLRNPSLNVRNPSNAAINRAFLNAIDAATRNKILSSIGKHYDMTAKEAMEEVTHAEAEHLLDYMIEPMRSATYVIMQRHGFGLARRNPSGAKQRARGVRGYDDFSGAGDSAALAWAAQTRREMAAAKRGRHGDLDVYRRSHAGDIAASSRHRPLRNPMSAAARKHLAHEKGEEKAFASMMAALAEGVTVKVGTHRIRKLSKGYVVVDGERLTTTQAAAKLHRGK
jgi:hypothetical protein